MYRMGLGVFRTGIGNEIGWPPIIGLGQPPALESKPLRLKMTRIAFNLFGEKRLCVEITVRILGTQAAL
jgi:hypothetical protein